MTIGFYNSYNNSSRMGLPAFKSEKIEAGVLTKPIEKVQQTIESGVDTLVKIPNEDKKKKKIKKRAIAATSAVLVLGTLTMFLNPKSSGKIIQKLKIWQNKLEVQSTKSKDNFLKSSLYKFYKKTINGIEKACNVYFNMNSGKDVVFQSMCTNSNKKYPEFLTKNKTVHNIVKTLDDGFVKIFKKPHEKITEFFDNISKSTVKNKYKKASRDLDQFEETIKLLREKLPSNKRKLVDSKLKEIAKSREVFSETKVLERLRNQESLMSGLSDDLWKRIYNKKDGFAKDKTTFWVQEALKPQKAQVEKEGSKIIEKFFGNKGKNGLYDDVLDIYRKHLSKEDMKILDDGFKTASKKIKKANYSECFEYFDRKRDMVVGGAPTDIVTQLFGVGLCGLAVTRADKEKRLQKAFTTGLPIITGLGSSLIFSALLYSGGVGLLAGAAVGGVTNIICHYVNKNVFGNKDDDDEQNDEQIAQNNQQNVPQEVKNA